MRSLKSGLFLAALALGSACSKDSPTGPGAPGGVLTLGSAITISGAAESEKYYTVVVPAGAGALRVTLGGSDSDADLFVRFGANPEPSAFDCSSQNFDATEECLIPSPAAGTWHIAVVGFEAYSGVQLLAEVVAGPAITELTSGVPLANQSGAEGSKRLFRITVPAGATSLIVTTSGGTGDVDLYARFNIPPTVATNGCASESESNTETCTVPAPTAGTWYVMLEGWLEYAGVTLTATVTVP